MALPIVQNKPDNQYWARQGADTAPNTTGDSIQATGELAAVSSLMQGAIDAYHIHHLDQEPNQRELTVPELHQKYNGLGIPWSSPMKERAAEYIAQAHREKALLANRAQSGEPGMLGSLGRGTVRIGTGLGDPVGLLAGVGTGAVARMGMGAAGILAGEGLGAAIGRGAVEGGTAMLPIEAGNIAKERMMQNDVELKDSLYGIGFGALLGGAMEGTFKALESKNVKPLPEPPGGKIRNEPGAPPPPPPTFELKPNESVERPFGSGAKVEHDSKAVDFAARQMEDGLRPDITALQDTYERQRQDTGVKRNPEIASQIQYRYELMDTSNPVTKEFYHGNVSANEDFHALDFAGNVNSMESFGPGVYGNDNINKANGHSEGGMVHGFGVKDAKLFAIDRPNSLGADVVEKALRSEAFNMPKFAEDLASGKINGRDVYANLTDEGKIAMNKILQEAGFDGLHFDDSARDGSSKSNGVMMFDHQDLQHTGAYQSDPRTLGGLSQSEVAKAVGADGDKTRELLHDPQAEEAIRQFVEQAKAAKPIDETEIQKASSEIKMELKSMEDNGILTDQHLKEIAEIKEAMGERAKQSERVVKSMFDCIAGH